MNQEQQVRALIVLPTFNEAGNLEPLVRDVLALPAPFDILVVDDNSPDGTGAIADRLANEFSSVHVLHRPSKLGLGTAYVAGFRWALARRYDVVLEMDCDFSHHPSYLPRFLDLAADADLVLGSRYIPGGATPDWGWRRRLLSGSGNLFARTLLGLHTRDCTTGFRCYRREIVERIPWEQINLRGYGFQISTVYHVERLGGRVAEFPITFDERRLGRSKMTAAIVFEALGFVMGLAFRERGRRQNVTAGS